MGIFEELKFKINWLEKCGQNYSCNIEKEINESEQKLKAEIEKIKKELCINKSEACKNCISFPCDISGYERALDDVLDLIKGA